VTVDNEPNRRRIDLLCVLSPRVDDSPPQQILEFELVVSFARGRGLTVETVGYPDRGEEPLDLETAAGSWQPRLVYWHLPGRQAWDRLRQEAQPAFSASSPPPVMVAGGGFATQYDAGVLEHVPFVDAVIRGEPEATLAALVECVRAGRPLETELGVTTRADGQTVRTAPRPLLRDLDALAVRTSDFFRPERVASEQRILLSRGCEANCQYCGLQTFYRNEFPGRPRSYWRARSAASVLAELERFHDLGVRQFIFNSFVFFGQDEEGTELVRSIAHGILDRGLELVFRFVTRTADLHRNLHLLPLLQRAGLGQLTFGLDSGLARPLEFYQIESTRRMALDCLQALADQQISFHTTYIFYDPYSTLSEVRENLQFLVSLAPYYRHLSMPFAYVLDQQLLSTTLRVKWSTPLYRTLASDGLAEDVDTLMQDPRIGMRDARVGRLFQAHQAVNRQLFPMVRALFFDPEVVRRYPAMERLPADLLEHLVVCYEQEPECSPRDAVRRSAGWLHQRLSETWSDMAALLDLDAEQWERTERFFETLGDQAEAA